ncbi:MAG: hypothetical protein OEY49_09450 [Candidatus Heimdallarchaeota archaeon]|nr:hypothetical protein [Candidatus Heimdallarchaeota archaeon]
MNHIFLFQMIMISSGILSLIPASILIKQYYQTKILDYLLFGLVFIFASISSISIVLAEETNSLKFFQLDMISATFLHLCLYIHSIRIKTEKLYKRRILPILLWAIIIILLILQWKILNEPNYVKVFYLEIPRSYYPIYPKGAGIIFNNFTYSTSFRLFSDLYNILILINLLIAYIKVKPVVNDPNIIRSKKLLLLISASWLIYWILLQPWIAIFTPIPMAIIGVTGLYLVIKFPEYVLISQSQVMRVRKLYNIVKEAENNNSINEIIGPESLIDYISRLREELFEDEIVITVKN